MPTNVAPKTAVKAATRSPKTVSVGAASPAVRAAKPAVAKKAAPQPRKAPAAPVKPLAKPAKVTRQPGALKQSASVAKAGSASKEKPKKSKLVRDSFTMPELEYAALSEVKKACLKAGFEVKKSELLRIGVAMIRKLELQALRQAVAALSPLKPGRPRKEK